jgi:heat-inducible transcriptional repressor
MQDRVLTQREKQVLEAVILSYVETAEPAGSRTIAKKYRLGVSAATIRNTMADLEDLGYLYHPHTSAGRMPTDLAYRVYVDGIINPPRLAATDRATLTEHLGGGSTPIEGLLDKAAQVLGVVTQELGVAVAPSLDDAVLEQLQLVSVSSDRLLMVLVLRDGLARSIFVEVSSHLPQDAVAKVAAVLNERLRALTLRQIRTTLRERLRDTAQNGGESELINIFVEEADQLFSVPRDGASAVVLGSAQMLAEQPEFNSNERMRDLLALTERRDVLQEVLRARETGGLTITIGRENVDPKLRAFTLVTSTYEVAGMSGVIGVMGPTRMPYKKVIALVEHTSRLMGDLF